MKVTYLFALVLGRVDAGATAVQRWTGLWTQRALDEDITGTNRKGAVDDWITVFSAHLEQKWLWAEGNRQLYYYIII